MNYVITVFSHFGAMEAKKELEKRNYVCRLAPAPRILSSSCGTCVMAEGQESDFAFIAEYLDEVFVREGSDYRKVNR